MNLKLDVTIEQLNVIMLALSKMPYEAVYSLIPTINEQAQRQMNNQQRTVGPP